METVSLRVRKTSTLLHEQFQNGRFAGHGVALRLNALMVLLSKAAIVKKWAKESRKTSTLTRKNIPKLGTKIA